MLPDRPPRPLRFGPVVACLLTLASVQPSVAHDDIGVPIARLTSRIAESPDSVSLYLERGELRRIQRDFAAARADYAEVERRDPGHAGLAVCRAALALDTGAPALARRLLDGARISLTVAFVVQIVVILIGVPIGAIAGWYSGSRIDSGLMRFTDVMYAFPDLLLIILFSVAFRETAFGQALNGLLLVFVAIGLTAWVTVARLVRGQFLSLKETEFVEAAQAIGVSDRNIVMRHLLPNGISPIIVAITLGVPAAILAEAALAYIGVGVQPPRASWGSLIAAGQPFIRSYPHLTYLPGIMIAFALISFTFLGDGLRDALDPKLKGKQ
jgi:oligopeptide transport system permease protein